MAQSSQHGEAVPLPPQVGGTRCNSCGSQRQRIFPSEINVHFPGLSHLDALPVLLFPELLVCLECGHAELTVSKEELVRLKQLL